MGTQTRNIESLWFFRYAVSAKIEAMADIMQQSKNQKMRIVSYGLTPKSVVFWRHVVGIVFLVIATIAYSGNIGSPTEIFGSLLGVFGVAILLAALCALFFTNIMRDKFYEVFIKIAWILALLVLVGGFAQEMISKNFSKKDSSVNSASVNKNCYLLVNDGKILRLDREVSGYTKVVYDGGTMQVYFEPEISKDMIEKFIDSNEKKLLGECGLTLTGTSIGNKK